MIAVILCGGSGTRLWPLSRKNYPKQFLNLCSDNSLLQDTYLRTFKVVESNKIFIVGNKDNYFHILNQIKDIKKDFNVSNIFIEPASLNTAPGIAFAIKTLIDKFNVDKNETILILPSDHYIGNTDEYENEIKKIDRFFSNLIITIGIKPSRPETGYGYIKKGEQIGDFYKVAAFKEKPDLETAEEYLKSGEYVWNSGIYALSSNVFIEECKKYCKDIYEIMDEKYENFIEKFKKLPSISIDYAISEKTNKIIVLESNLIWSDIGSFDRLSDLKNIKESRNIDIDSKNVFSYSNTDKLIVTLGVDDINIIENNDTILVQRRGKSEDIKKVVDYLKKYNLKELDEDLITYRPWGRVEVLIDTPNYKVKKIIVYPECELSLQSHMHRVEHWIVVYGVASVINGDKEFLLKKNESTYIEQNIIHKLKNPGKINLEVVEVQTGEYLGEDDIIRYDNIYNIEIK